ncbi:uncharacterized protein BO96DRAFT_146414 [Aspergillus niger CBS 101883]|uniref:uncharacterized protein n=1 Tax=Aspergillus lacticoffeatus (strain CBS 101883) TaxID=1450533 RepID=UPI000D7F9394|nr:uncharacterized protein BO96DRAFT_146414 [Aspergillus niger CBS 101883]PYH60696.1 hypothetical protein BO96DRAFT_146414 [Aspergillus niger CBS 101883]
MSVSCCRVQYSVSAPPAAFQPSLSIVFTYACFPLHPLLPPLFRLLKTCMHAGCCTFPKERASRCWLMSESASREARKVIRKVYRWDVAHF